MLALGCLFPVFLALAGGLVGSFVGGQPAILWGGALGAIAGCAIPALMLFALVRARERR